MQMAADVQKVQLGTLLDMAVPAMAEASKSGLWVPSGGMGMPIGSPGVGGVDDPRVMGYDKRLYDVVGEVVQERDHLDYSGGNADSVNLTKKGLITGIGLVADPYRHDVTTAAITVVQDAVDKVLSALSINGGGTYLDLNSSSLYLKALSALNKTVHKGAIAHGDLATAVGADNDSYHSWLLHFGFLNDFNPFDISSGIPAGKLTNLVLAATFGTDQIIATTAANGTIDPNTDIYVVTFIAQGLPDAYYSRMPLPQFEHDHKASPTSTTRFDLKAGLFLKRTTMVSLAAAASNNAARNDSNITDLSIVFEDGIKRQYTERMRWRVAKHIWQAVGGAPESDRDGAAALAAGGLDGVLVIDWRRVTGNPLGLNLVGLQTDQLPHIDFTIGTTTGSLHAFHEYYRPLDPTVWMGWPSYDPVHGLTRPGALAAAPS